MAGDYILISVTIGDGRRDLYQWDIDRVLKITGAGDGAIVNFIDKETLPPLPVKLENGQVVVPNSLLRSPRLFLKLFVCDENHTLGSARIRVIAQPKPDGYMMDEDDILTWERLFEECGVYTPSVSSDGLLTWSKSKSTMKDIPSVNITGPKGEDGGIIVRKWAM